MVGVSLIMPLFFSPIEYHRIRYLTTEASLHQLDMYPVKLPAAMILKKSDKTRHVPIPG